MLTEHDARQITTQVVTELHRLGASVRMAGVTPDADGLLIHAQVNGRVVCCRLPAGTYPYRTVALELLGADVDATLQALVN